MQAKGLSATRLGPTAQLWTQPHQGQLHRPSYGSKFELNCPFGSWMPHIPTAQFSPAPLLLRPLAKPTALCTVVPKSFGTNFCVLYSSHPIGRSPKTISLFLTWTICTDGPALGGGYSLESSVQVGPTSEHRPLVSGALGLPTAPSPLHKDRAKRGRRVGGMHAKRAGQPSDPAVGTRTKKEGPGTACPGLLLVGFHPFSSF